MAGEIQGEYPPGATLYGRVTTLAPLTAWNGSGFEVPTPTNWPAYAIAMAPTAAGSSLYSGDFPAAIPPGTYNLSVLVRGGATPAVTDVPLGGENLYSWPGVAGSGLTPSPTPPPYVAPGQAVGSMTVRDGQGNPVPGGRMWFMAVSGGVDRQPFPVDADASGVVQAAFVIGVSYVGWFGDVRPLWLQLADFQGQAASFTIPPLLVDCL